MKNSLTITDVSNNNDELWNIFDSVPFGQSKFQIEKLVINHVSPARLWRQALLELFQKAQALHKARCDRDRSEIEIRQKNREIASLKKNPTEETDDEIALLKVDIQEKEFGFRCQEKLIADALIEVKNILDVLEKVPAYDRDGFEKEEPEYWQKRFVLQAKNEILQSGSISAGLLESIQKIGFDPTKTFMEIKEIIRIEQSKPQLKQSNEINGG
jgi:hypothetical protein